MKKINICSVIVGSSLNEFLKNLDKVQEISELVELRVDLIKNLNENNLRLIRKKTIKKAIFTCRKKEIFLKALNLGFDYIDVKLSLIPNLNLPKRGKTEIILSFHDFKKTPSFQELTTIADHMRKCKIGIIKIATMVNSDQDAKNLFKILLSKKKDEKMIIIGMGEKGKIVRILGPLLGSFLTYASTPYGKTALGQIDINKMQNIYKLLVTNN